MFFNNSRSDSKINDMCINVVNFQTTKKTTKKQHEHDQASKDTKLHALSFTGNMFMNGHVVLTGV